MDQPTEVKVPKWFKRIDPFSAEVDLNSMGYPKVKLRDPPGGRWCELGDFQEKNPLRSVTGMAETLRTYVCEVDHSPIVVREPRALGTNGPDDQGDPGETKKPSPMPGPASPLNEWKQWVATTPSTVWLRINDGRLLIAGGVDEGN